MKLSEGLRLGIPLSDPVCIAVNWLAVLLLVGIGGYNAYNLSAAQEKAVTDKPRLESFHALPLYGPDGGLSSLRVTAIFRVMMLMPDGKEMRPHLRSIEFDLVQHAGQSVILSNSTGKEIVELADFGSDLMGVSDFMWGLNNPSPLPVNPAPIVRRKTMREKKAP